MNLFFKGGLDKSSPYTKRKSPAEKVACPLFFPRSNLISYEPKGGFDKSNPYKKNLWN